VPLFPSALYFHNPHYGHNDNRRYIPKEKIPAVWYIKPFKNEIKRHINTKAHEALENKYTCLFQSLNQILFRTFHTVIPLSRNAA
jgi:hypothetical protein